MKSETVIGALIAAVIGVGTAFLALMNQEGVTVVGDISQKAWIVLGIGGLLAFLKDFQSITTRRALATMTGSRNVHSFLVPLLGVGLLLGIAGCAGTQSAYSAANAQGTEATAKVVAEHYYALVKEARLMKDAGTLAGSDLLKAQDIVRSTSGTIDTLAAAAKAFEGTATAQTQAELDQAILDASQAISDLIDLIAQVKDQVSYFDKQRRLYVKFAKHVSPINVNQVVHS
ncbi:MAG: hypothetical protein ACR2PR_07505 [Pseudohongiellaceae bacterium]